MLALSAFREGMVTSNQDRDWSVFEQPNFNDYDSRRVRYDILWALYESTIFRNVHKWAVTYKTVYGLYKYTRNIYNPSYRLGEFWKAHLWGGSIDPDAKEEGALPVVTGIEALRPAIAQIWKWSNFQINKDIWTLNGAILGDVIVKVIDDVENEKVYFEYIPPGQIETLVKDNVGNVRGYTLIKPIEWNGKLVTFKEVVSRDGQNVVYQTFLNDVPFDYKPEDGNGKEWTEPYGFVPMVHIKHNDVGHPWGWSELHPARPKIHEVDDLASILSDQIRKTQNSGWLYAGVKKPTRSNATQTTDDGTVNTPEPGRESVPALYTIEAGARAIPLVAPFDILGAVGHIDGILREIERDYPELRFDNLRTSGTVSGEALRTARQPAETKVSQRRTNYDNALVRLNQMALSIGGLRNYFQLGENSYENGGLDHSIGSRPVFTISQFEKLEAEKEFWQAANEAIKAGVPLEAYLGLQGWDQEKIETIINSEAFQNRMQEARDQRDLRALALQLERANSMDGEGISNAGPPTDQTV